MSVLIDHIALLVPDLEAAIERWSGATGYEFSPIGRYRSDRYVDGSAPHPHRHDARFSVSRQARPRIELLEATGDGTHSLSQVGPHHLAFIGYEDLEAEAERLRGLGMRVDAENTDDEGRQLLVFTDKQQLDGVRLEIVSSRVAPILWDDGTPAGIDPTTGRRSLWTMKEQS